MQLALVLLLSLTPAVLSDTITPAGSANSTLLWGAYRPNLYFGLRPRIPQSLMTGLMWFGTQDYQSVGSEWDLFRIKFRQLMATLLRNPSRL